MRFLLAALAAALFLVSHNVSAMPGAAGGGNMMDAARQAFAKADTDKDGSLTKEEFMNAFKGMKEEAFTAIDTDRDGKISREEWQAFSINHSMGREGQGSGMPPRTDGEEPKTDLPLITPPAQ